MLPTLLRNQPCSCGSGRRFKHCCGGISGFSSGAATSLLSTKMSALREQHAGNLEAAESLYRMVLRRQPDDVESLHMLGVVCYETQRFWDAFQHIRRALDLTGWQVALMRDSFGLVLAMLSAKQAQSAGSLADDVEANRATLNDAKAKLVQASQLAGTHLPEVRVAPMGAAAGQEKDRRARVLVVDLRIPTPDRDSGSVRAVAVMRILRQLGCKVTFAASNMEFATPYGDYLQQDGIEVLHQPYSWTIAEILTERGSELDMVFVSRHNVAQAILADVRRYAPKALLVFDTVDLHYLREHREAVVTGDPEAMRNAAITRRQELAVAAAADVTVVVSTYERAILERELPGRTITVVSNIQVVSTSAIDFDLRRDMFFVGGFGHRPNVDGVQWFSHEIWPKVRLQLPDVKVFLIGSEMPPSVAALAGEGIEPLGHLPDLTSHLERCRISIAPLRYGAGVKGKISLAQSWGIPVVATTVAVEGMQLEHLRDVLVGDTPEDFANAIVRLYTDRILWTVVSEGGRANVARHFSPEAATGAIDQLVTAALGNRRMREIPSTAAVA